MLNDVTIGAAASATINVTSAVRTVPSFDMAMTPMGNASSTDIPIAIRMLSQGEIPKWV